MSLISSTSAPELTDITAVVADDDRDLSSSLPLSEDVSITMQFHTDNCSGRELKQPTITRSNLHNITGSLRFTVNQSNFEKVENDTENSNTTDSGAMDQLKEPDQSVKRDSLKVGDVSGNLSKYFRVEQCRFNQPIYMNAATLLRKFKRDAAKSISASISRVGTEHVSTATHISLNPTEQVSEKKPEADNADLQHSPTATGLIASNPPRISTVVSQSHSQLDKKASKGKIKYKNLKEKKLTYELALGTLKFESIFEKILEETGFFVQYPDFREEDQVVLVIFNDYVKRKFQKRSQSSTETEEPGYSLVAEEIESCIFQMRTKLTAAVMRTRVKFGVRSLNQLLPEHYRIGEEYSEKMLVYMWYNSNITSNTDAVRWLTDSGFKRVSAAKILDQNEFYQDRHCPDLYVFHHDDRDLLQESEIVVKKRMAVVQDKSTSLALHCFVANVVQGEEIAIINPTTLLTAIHIEGLLKNKFGSVIPLAPIRVFRPPKDDDDPKLFPKMGSLSIKVHTEDVLTLDPTNEKYRYIRHALFQAKCTRSAVVSPIDFLDTEQDDISLLKDYAMRASLDGAKPHKISDSIVRNSMILRQCFRFTAIRAVTYLTHSVYDEENDLLINKTVELINKVMVKDTLEPNGKYECFVNVPPNIPMLVDDLTEHGILHEKNVCYPPSAETNGFFISLYAKENRYQSMDATEGGGAHEKSKKKKKKGGTAILTETAPVVRISLSADNANH